MSKIRITVCTAALAVVAAVGAAVPAQAAPTTGVTAASAVVTLSPLNGGANLQVHINIWDW